MQVSRRVGAVVTSVAALAVVACGILTGPVYASVVVHVCRGAGR
jgi:hypothetical protein